MENFNIEQYNIIDHLEVGSKVFDWMFQEFLEVEEINSNLEFAITAREEDYSSNGLWSMHDKFPRLTLEEWHPFSGKPFPKLPEKKVLEVFVFNPKSNGDFESIIGYEKDGFIFKLVDMEIKDHVVGELKDVIERTPYTGKFLK